MPQKPYKPLPESWVGSTDHFDPAITVGYVEWKDQKVVVISPDAKPEDILAIDQQFPRGYIRVQAGIADQETLGNARVAVDPRRGSRLAHNVNRLMPRIGAGDLCYIAGASLQFQLRRLDYDQAAPGIRVSRSPVTVIANGLSSRLFVGGQGESRVLPAVPLLSSVGLPKVENLIDALKANGQVERVIFLNDHLATVHGDDPAQLQKYMEWAQEAGVELQAFSNPKYALSALREYGRQALFMVDGLLGGGQLGGDVIRQAREEGFDGFIIGCSAEHFLALHERMNRPDLFDELGGLKRQKTFSSRYPSELGLPFWKELSAVLAKPGQRTEVTKNFLPVTAGNAHIKTSWVPAFESAIREEFERLSPLDWSADSFVQAMRLFITTIELKASGVEEETLDSLAEAFGRFRTARFGGDVDFEEMEPLDAALIKALRQIQAELAYPLYPAEVDSRIVQLIQFFVSLAQPAGLPVALETAHSVSSRPSAPFVLAVDDDFGQISRLEDAAHETKGVEFAGFTGPDQVDLAKMVLQRRPVDMLVMDVFIGVSPRAHELLKAAIETAERLGTSFDMLIVSGADPAIVTELQQMKAAHPSAIRSMQRVSRSRDEGAEALSNLLSAPQPHSTSHPSDRQLGSAS